MYGAVWRPWCPYTRLRRNDVKNLKYHDSEATSSLGSSLVEHVELFSRKMDLKVFCIILLCNLSYSSKAPESDFCCDFAVPLRSCSSQEWSVKSKKNIKFLFHHPKKLPDNIPGRCTIIMKYLPFQFSWWLLVTSYNISLIPGHASTL